MGGEGCEATNIVHDGAYEDETRRGKAQEERRRTGNSRGDEKIDNFWIRSNLSGWVDSQTELFVTASEKEKT